MGCTQTTSRSSTRFRADVGYRTLERGPSHFEVGDTGQDLPREIVLVLTARLHAHEVIAQEKTRRR